MSDLLLQIKVAMGDQMNVDAAPPLVKPGWRLTFHDEFDRPQLDDMYWFAAYRSGRKEYFKRIGHESRWVDHNAHYVIEDSALKLRSAWDHAPRRRQPPSAASTAGRSCAKPKAHWTKKIHKKAQSRRGEVSLSAK